ncbi:sulfurtransferase TusA family protein [Thermohalobacter berrensis]|uniref:Response regulator SirA n=1 Tax=Thermohalobacter berrensis TaxID=99594 RepID=A0A419SUX7_9FIRM|nr:sulfurtransferase TusA family protein [Thermohalobacter berrensis]RKD29029.1 response regulator SirA [Thermohalobacter berrensis]
MKEVRIDCMHEICPIPLLKAMKELKKMAKGEILVLETNHSCSIANVVEWAKKQGHNVDYMEVSEGEWEIYIEK